MRLIQIIMGNRTGINGRLRMESTFFGSMSSVGAGSSRTRYFTRLRAVLCFSSKHLFLGMTNKPRASLFLFNWKNVKYVYESVRSCGYHMTYV